MPLCKYTLHVLLEFCDFFPYLTSAEYRPTAEIKKVQGTARMIKDIKQLQNE